MTLFQSNGENYIVISTALGELTVVKLGATLEIVIPPKKAVDAVITSVVMVNTSM